ncbi:MAG: BON domain-containing protein [Nitrospira sp.]|nr:BON domain-containing protein [Nitrospira sp.]
MAMRCRWLIVLGLFIIWPIGARSQASDAHDKEGLSEKPASGSSQPPAVPAAKSEAATEHKTEHKEVVPEKPALRQQPSPASSDAQPTPHKSPAESKPTSLPTTPTKAESSTDRKEGTLEKIPTRPSSSTVTEGHGTSPKPSGETKSQGQPAPAIKADLQPSADIDLKEKETTAKKPMGSLILSVKLALMGDLRLFHYEIEVEDDKQVVTLTGRVSNEEEKAAATEVAQAVSGVKTVTNKLIVEKDLAKTLLKKQDEILTLLIKERFAKSATLKSANFDVKTEEGIVQLNGTVRFQVIALEAAEAARQVPGVRAVNTEKIRLEGES